MRVVLALNVVSSDDCSHFFSFVLTCLFTFVHSLQFKSFSQQRVDSGLETHMATRHVHYQYALMSQDTPMETIQQHLLYNKLSIEECHHLRLFNCVKKFNLHLY